MNPIKIVKGFALLPAAPGMCAMCACDHTEDTAHNWESIFYQMRFYLKYGRGPSTADAVAHLKPADLASWRRMIQEFGKWTDPDGGAEPVAEPYAISDPFCQEP